MAELSLWLDDYDDIYSDFDSRHYLKRRISEDFVDELKASLKHKPEHPDALVLLLPAQLRNTEIEKEIVSSMQEQFRARLQTLRHKVARIRTRGLVMLASGIMIMVINSIISYKARATYLSGLIRIILEPAAWFMIWNGLDFLIYEYRNARTEMSFYKTIGQLSLHFKDA